MTKILKIFRQALLGTLEWLLLFLIFFCFALRSSTVQTFLAQKATDFLSKELNTRVSIGKLDIVFIDRVDLKDFLLMNQDQSDTIANVGSLLVNINGFSNFKNQLKVDGITLERGVVKIEKDTTGVMNLKFVLDYFKSDKKKKKKEALPIFVDDLQLKDIRFHYNNFKSPAVQLGMDYQHLLLSNVNLDARKISMIDGAIVANVRHLSANEKCGFVLDHFQGKINLSNKGVEINKVNITTADTELNSERFRLLYTSYTQYKTFVDSVAFEADLNKSVVSLKDVAYFAPQLDGMDQKIQIEGKFTKFIKDLRAEEFVIKTGERTELRGTINLPDFRSIKDAFYHEKIDYVFVDLADIQNIKLPKKSSSRRIKLDPTIQRLKYVEAHDIRLDGIYSQFVLSSDEIKTAIGSVNMDNGILFTHNAQRKSFEFSHSEASDYDVKINEFNLGTFLGNSMVGVVDGTFFLSGEARSFSDIDFNKIEGHVNRFDLADYSYSNIKVENTSFVDKMLYAEVKVDDRNLDLAYKGTIDLNGEPKMNMALTVDKAFLGKLKLMHGDSTDLSLNIVINTVGLNPNTMEGVAVAQNIHFTDGKKDIKIPNLTLKLDRNPTQDQIEITSSLLNVKAKGKIDFNSIGGILEDQLSKLVPGLMSANIDPKKKKKPLNSTDRIDFGINLIDVKPILDVFAPKLEVAPGSRIFGNYDAAERSFDMSVISDFVAFDGKMARGIHLHQVADSGSMRADYNISALDINDSITIETINFSANGNGDNLRSILTWNPATSNESKIEWNTKVESDSRFLFTLEPSYFAIKSHQWIIEKEASILIDSTIVDVKGLKLMNGYQYIVANGRVSKNDEDKLNFELNEVNLNHIAEMLGLNVNVVGKLNGWGYITNPYENMTYMGDLNVKGLAIDNEEVGDVYLMSQWDKNKNMIDLSGDLIYRNMPTFQFKGNYDIKKEEDNLDFDLVFDNTNISFLNAFMDPKVVDDIRGYINGTLDVTGSIKKPIIEGKVNLDKAGAKIAMFGTSFSFTGPVIADEYGFYINNIPISDAEGNTGGLTGTIYHENFKDWNFDVGINIEEDYYKRNAARSWEKMPLDHFLVMNTNGDNGDLYYGKAYATGSVGISGYLNNLDIMVNLKTQKGTWINLALFGQSELSEDNFIEFVSKDTMGLSTEKKIDFTGVSLNLNFDVTQDAQIKLIIDEQTGNEITARGDGRISLGLDNVGQMRLDGTYTVREGSNYNFVLGPIKETFYIAEGGSITWTGNPFEANLNLQAYYKVRANLGDLSPELLVSGNQEVNCYLNLSESLMKPTINFDIKAPKAPEPDKALLTQLTADPDEMNRQFFSLLLWKKFQPLKGSSRASGGAALDLASNQINSLLSQVSQEYRLNVDMNDDGQGKSEYALGVEKGFLEDQLIISGSFGTRNSNTGNQSQSSLIGDIELEYKLNKNGTFRVNVFNVSNDNRGLQSNNRGQFKQGIGIYYKESFNTFGDFKLLQQFFDVFRAKENKRYPIRRKKQQTPIPKDAVVPKEK